MVDELILQLEAVSLVKNGKVLLEEIDLALRKGEAVAILGPSGAGKSSLLRLINRLDEPTRGCILFKDKDIRSLPPRNLRQRIALAFQTPVLFPGDVLSNFHRTEQMNQRPCQPMALYEEKLQQVGLSPHLLKQEAASLSLGEKQRVALARSLLNQPEILLLDEPTSALDPASADHLLDAIYRLQQQMEITLLMVTHQQEHGARIGSRMITLDAGKILEEKPASLPY